MKKPLLVFALEQESQKLFDDQDILYTGVGKINATHRLLGHIHKSRPDIVINLGTAGSSNITAGNLVHCTLFVQRDMDVSPLGFPVGKTPFCDEPVNLQYGESVPYLPHASCGTGDSFDIEHNGAHFDIVDMEAYALARVCKEQKIPFICLKYISDGANGNAAADWDTALKIAARELRIAFDKLDTILF